MAFDVKACRDELARQLPEMTRLLETLVNIDSGSYCHDGVNQVVSLIQAQLETVGFACERRAMPECADQLIATRRLGGTGRLLILGHADTVWPEHTVAQWPFSVDKGIATGPGVGDMKGGLVMALFALRHLLGQGFAALESITFFLVPDEELGSVYSRPALEAASREADFVLVLEPGRPGGGIVTARGALGAFQLCAHGRSAHCAVNYAKGASAIRALAATVAPLEALSDPAAGQVVNVGMFHGGAARQVVPAEARIDIDMRARTQAQADALIEQIRAIGSTRRVEGVSLDLHGGLTRPAFTSEHNGALRDRAFALAAELGIDMAEVPPTGGGSDGNFSAALGIPTLDALGPVCENICARDETIALASLYERGALFCGLIQQLHQTKGI